MMLRGVNARRPLFAKTGGLNEVAKGSSTMRKVWKPRFCMSATVRIDRENTNPERHHGMQQAIRLR